MPDGPRSGPTARSVAPSPGAILGFLVVVPARSAPTVRARPVAPARWAPSAPGPRTGAGAGGTPAEAASAAGGKPAPAVVFASRGKSEPVPARGALAHDESVVPRRESEGATALAARARRRSRAPIERLAERPLDAFGSGGGSRDNVADGRRATPAGRLEAAFPHAADRQLSTALGTHRGVCIGRRADDRGGCRLTRLRCTHRRPGARFDTLENHGRLSAIGARPAQEAGALALEFHLGATVGARTRQGFLCGPSPPDLFTSSLPRAGRQPPSSRPGAGSGARLGPPVQDTAIRGRPIRAPW